MANLPIPDEQTYISFPGATGVGPFPFTFSLFAKADLRVSLDGDELLQTDFTFSGIAATGGFDGGSITLNGDAAGQDLVIWREVVPARATDFAPANSVPVAAIDQALDRLTAYSQDARRDRDRALLVPIGEGPMPLPNAVTRASKFLAFDTNGYPVVAVGTSGGVPVSAFGASLIDDASADAARTTLGLAPIFSRPALAAAPSALGRVFLIEGGRSGSFSWSSANLSAQVTSDPAQGVYVAPASSPTGVAGAWVRNRADDALNPRWFGAIANGVSNPISGLFASLGAAQVFYPFATALTNQIDHLAIVSALNFGLVVELGAGSFFVDRAISVGTYEAVLGAGRYNTFVTTTSATANVFDVDGYYTKISGIAFRSSVARTAGYAVSWNAGAAGGNLSDFSVDSFYQGLNINGVAVFNITDGSIDNTLAGGVSVRVGGGFAIYMRAIGMSTSSVSRCFAHFVLTHVSDLTLDYIQALLATNVFYINPGVGQEIDSLTVSNSYFDQPLDNAIVFSGAGKFQRSSFVNTWFCGGANTAIEFNTTAAGEVTGIKFTGCILAPGPSGTPKGVRLKGPNTRNLTFSNCSISGMTDGINYDTCTGGLVVSGCRIGLTDGFTPNTNGINLVGVVDNYVITGNDLRSNVTTSIAGHVAAGNKIAANNLV